MPCTGFSFSSGGARNEKDFLISMRTQSLSGMFAACSASCEVEFAQLTAKIARTRRQHKDVCLVENTFLILPWGTKRGQDTLCEGPGR